MKAAVEARNLFKSFSGGAVGVAGLDLSVPSGTIYGLIGRNGSGKTTTLRLLMGLLRADQGQAHILGENMWTAKRALRQQIAYVSQNLQTPGWMTPRELFRYTASFYDEWDRGFADGMAKRWGIPMDRAIGHLSGGQQRQASVIAALAARPKVLLLDEPAGGLDAVVRRQLLEAIVDLAMDDFGCTVLFSTHYIGDLERVAEHVGMLDRGRITLSARSEDLLTKMKRVQVVFDQAEVPSGFRIPGARCTEIAGPVARGIVHLEEEAVLDSIREIKGIRIHTFPLNLEEIFVELYGGNLSEAKDEPVDTRGLDPGVFEEISES